MRDLFYRLKKERKAVLFVLWTLSILVVGGELYNNWAKIAGIVALYLVFDVLYYGSQILATSTAAAKAYAERLERPTIWDRIIGGAARDRRSRILAWVAMIVGLLQPATAFLVAALVLRLRPAAHWAGYGYLLYDLVSTFLVWGRVLRDIRAERFGRVRPATLADVEKLRDLEVAAFPDPDQQFRLVEIQRAIRTSPGTILVIDLDGAIVGSISARLIRASEYRNRDDPPTWDEMANNCDLTPSADADAMYIINIAGMPGHNVAERLEAATTRLAIRSGLRFVWGGPRIPGFHKWARPRDVQAYLESHDVPADIRREMLAPRPKTAPNGLTVEEYVFQTGPDGWPIDKLLRTLMKEAGFSVLGRRVQLLYVIGALKSYFGDPVSLDTGALVEFKNPFHGWPVPRFWGFLMEQLLLHF